jgi:FkbM family methyltransferase
MGESPSKRIQPMNPSLKYHLKHAAAVAGFAGRPIHRQRRTLREFCVHLRDQMQYVPSLIVDVGVADGTFDIYTVFPRTRYLLVEPLAEFVPAMEWISRRYAAEIVIAAAGSIEGDTTIQFGSALDEMHGATLVDQMSTSDGKPLQTRTVPVRRLDCLISERGLTGSIFLKVDTQGSELDVVSSAQRILDRVEVIVVEASLFHFNQSQPEIGEVISSMAQIDYVPYDLFDGYNRPFDDALGQIDIAFVKRDGFFRNDQQYGDLEKRGARASAMRVIRRTLKF